MAGVPIPQHLFLGIGKGEIVGADGAVDGLFLVVGVVGVEDKL